MFTSSIKREFRQFHLVVVQWRQRNVQKSLMHVQSCCFAYLNLLLFCRSRWRRRRRSLSSLSLYGYPDGDDKENVKKQLVEHSQAKQQLCTCITLSCTFLCRHCTTMTGKCLILRFMEDVNKRRVNFLSLSDLEYRSKEFGSNRVRLHLIKLVSWSNCDRDWKNANSLFLATFSWPSRRGIF